MKAGFSEVNITPPLGTDMPGDFVPHTAQSSWGDLYANAMAISVGSKTIILVSVDILSFKPQYADEIRQRITERTGVPADHILIAATHIHTGSALGYQLWLCPPNMEISALSAEGIFRAAVMAWENMEDASLGTGQFEEKRFSFCRDIHMSDGSIKMNPNKKHPELMVKTVTTPDYSVDVMRVDGVDGSIKAFIVNYANHPDCHNGNKNFFSADFPGAMRRALKQKYGENVKVLFFNGTAGDINCIDFIYGTSDVYYGKDKNAPLTIGNGLAEDIEKINDQIMADVKEPYIDSVSRRYQTGRRFKTQKDYEFALETAKDMSTHSNMDRAFATEYLESDEGIPSTVDIEIQTIRLGPWTIVGLPSEIFTEIGRKIKTQSPYEHTLVFELANGTHGYISTPEIIHSDAYEAKVSKYNAYTDETTADMLVRNSLLQLEELSAKEQV